MHVIEKFHHKHRIFAKMNIEGQFHLYAFTIS